METLVEALRRLGLAGYSSQFVATDDGELRCTGCNALHRPEEMTIDETVRFEGESSSGDEAIVVALRCACGVGGTFTSAYGADASAADIAVLTRLPRH